MNQTSINRLSKVHPILHDKVVNLIENLLEQGLVVEVVQGLRTIEEQDALYAQGRTKPGVKVTNAKGGDSNHNYGLAVDLCPFINSKPSWNDNAGFSSIGAEANKVGLEWGGNWKSFKDKPHVQLPGLTIKQCKDLYKRGGIKAVWDSVP